MLQPEEEEEEEETQWLLWDIRLNQQQLLAALAAFSESSTRHTTRTDSSQRRYAALNVLLRLFHLSIGHIPAQVERHTVRGGKCNNREIYLIAPGSPERGHLSMEAAGEPGRDNAPSAVHEAAGYQLKQNQAAIKD